MSRKISRIRRLLGSVRGQLIMGVALVHALMMTMFIWDLTERQQALLLQRQAEQAQSLAESLAVSSAGWLGARDVAGLQEIIQTQQHYSELEFAMVLDLGGQILAHSQSQQIGRYVRDLPSREAASVVSRSAALVDVYNPVVLGGRPIGWVRVGIGQRIAGDQLAEITRAGWFYAVAAILLGALMAGWLGARLTRKLYAIREVTAAVISQGGKQRVPALGRDEAADLAQDFNAMLDVLDQRDAALAQSIHQVAASQARLHSLVRAMPDLVWLKDPDGVYLLCNPRFERFFGASEADILGHTDYDFVDREQADFFRSKDMLATLGDHPNVNEEWITFADDGHRELVETIKMPLRNSDGELIGVFGVARDITERKRSEELQRYAAFQAGLAEMGVSVLHNIGNAVTAMSDDASAISKAGDDLFRIAELLKQNADACQEHPDEMPALVKERTHLLAIQREAARAIGHIVEKSIQLRGKNIFQSVRHIADMVHIQQSAALPGASASTFDLGQAIENALTMQGDSLKNHDIVVDTEIDPLLTYVTMSHNKLLQALVNAVKNAFEAILQRQQEIPGEGRISLRAKLVDDKLLRLSVSDNGIGFAPEQQTNFFNFGYSTKARGSGFGLHATALFVHEMDGDIRLQSDGPNLGATLVMDLPLKNNSVAAAAVAD